MIWGIDVEQAVLLFEGFVVARESATTDIFLNLKIASLGSKEGISDIS